MLSKKMKATAKKGNLVKAEKSKESKKTSPNANQSQTKAKSVVSVE